MYTIITFLKDIVNYTGTLFPQVLEGLKVTMEIFLLTLILSIPLGVLVALGRLSKIKIINKLTGFYVLIMRGTPLLLQIVFIFFGLPNLNIVIDRFPAAIIAFTLNYAAYFGEIFRAGISSVDIGQNEASQVLGLSKKDTFFRIILPQAFKTILPPIANEIVTLVKDTALVYVIGIDELLRISKGYEIDGELKTDLENYKAENLDIYGITPNVLMASYLLKEKLNNLGIPSIVEDTNMSEMLSVNGWDYTYSYKASRLLILSKKSEYPSLKYFIDIHRDSVSKDMSTATINGKSYAKILFVVGQDYTGWETNYQEAVKVNNILEKKAPNISRGILKKTGMNVNGVYNQDLSNNSLLIELGATDNTIEEVLNTLNVIAEVLKEYIKG